jgi:RHS repeat-associated protein
MRAENRRQPRLIFLVSIVRAVGLAILAAILLLSAASAQILPPGLVGTTNWRGTLTQSNPAPGLGPVWYVAMTMGTNSGGGVIINGFDQNAAEPQYWIFWTAEGSILSGKLTIIGSAHAYNLPFGDFPCDVGGTYSITSYTITGSGQGSGDGGCSQSYNTTSLTNLSGGTLGDGPLACITCLLKQLLSLPGNSDQQVQGGVKKVGHPIDVATGNVVESVMDYQTAGPNRLSFIRYYNSQSPVVTYAVSMGKQWRTNYDRYLNINPAILSTYVVNGSTANIIAERPDGSSMIFSLVGGTWTTDSYNDATLTVGGSTYTLTLHDDTVETYAASGEEAKLTSITYRGGYSQRFAYNGSGQLATVTDTYGRQLAFTYSSGLLAEVTTPDSLVLSYDYNSSGASHRLSSVSYNTQPATSQSYNYTDTSFLFALTSITDEDENTYASWTYDIYGRALTSQHAGGADLTSVVYNDGTDGSRTVTNPLGEQEQYFFYGFGGLPRLAQITRLNGGGYNYTLSYDSNNFVASVTDWDNHVTTYTNDQHGDPTVIVEASGTSIARTTTITYDSAHNHVHLPATVVTPGLTTTYTYDSNGNPVTITGTDTTTTTIPYPTNGQMRTSTLTWNNLLPASITPPKGDGETTNFTYDATGALTRTTNALGQEWQITSHTGGGRPLTILDPNRVTTTLTYSPRNWLLTSTVATSGGNRTTTNTYDGAGNVIKVTQPDNSYYAATYDAAHRLTKVADSFGNSMNYALDAGGDATASNIKNPSGTVTRGHNATFDALRRKLTDVNGTGYTASYAYFNNGALSTYLPANSITHYYMIDALNRRVSENVSQIGTIYYAYDAHDRPLAVESRNGVTTSYVYDGFGDAIQQASPDSGTTVYYFDLDGDLSQKVDALGIITNHTYDVLDRVLTTSYPADPPENVTYTYDQTGSGFAFGIGRLTTLTDAVGSLTRSYDERGNLITEQRTAGSAHLKTTYGYDAASRIASITYPSGTLVTYVRDAMGRITTVTGKPLGMPIGRVLASNVTYEPLGPWLSLTYGNGIAETVTYDGDYSMLTLKDIGTASIQNIAYTYDGYDLPGAYTDNLSPNNDLSVTYGWLLDMGGINYHNGGISNNVDNNSNRTSYTGAPQGSFNYTYSPSSNRLATISQQGAGTTTVTTNANGNITGFSLPFGAGGVTSLSYNNANRLSQVTGVSGLLGAYAYDGFGNRFSKTIGSVTTLYTSAPDTTLLEETTGGQARDYVYLNGRPLAMLTGATFVYLHGDNIGTPQVATSSTQAVVWNAAYLPFGETLSTSGSVTVNLRMPGQYYDAESGFSHNGFRDYAFGLGRYVETDPIGITPGLDYVLSGRANSGTDPLGISGELNTYAYVSNRPMDLVDPDGLVNQNWLSPTDPRYPWGQSYNKSGTYTVLGEGDPQHFCGPTPCGEPGTIPIPVERLAQLIYADPNYQPGMPVELIACETGVGENSYAQQLAQKLGELAAFAGHRDFSTVYGADGLVHTPFVGYFDLPPFVTKGWRLGSFLPFEYHAPTLH